MPDARIGDNIGYLTFGKNFYLKKKTTKFTRIVLLVLFPRHTKAAARDNTINLIHTLRNYFHYHIKCCKVSLDLLLLSGIISIYSFVYRHIYMHICVIKLMNF
jgi:actin related protein 2/3 complex subunit 2